MADLTYLHQMVSESNWTIHQTVMHVQSRTMTQFWVMSGNYLTDVTLPIAAYFGYRLDKTQTFIPGNFDNRVERDLSRLFGHRVLVLLAK